MFVPEGAEVKKEALKRILDQQLAMYPEMKVQDCYTLVYQGVMGRGPAVSSAGAAEDWLRQEILDSSVFPSKEPLFEEISPDGAVLRINLRPFLAAAGDTDRLLTAFIRTGREFRGSSYTLFEWWSALVSMQNRFAPEDMKEFMDRQSRNNFPAVHHSSIYRELYMPAYRVASKAICIEEGVIR